jgi:anti-anti-sigma factor
MIEFQNRQIKLADGTQVVVCRILGSIDGAVLPQFEEKLLGFTNEGIKYLILVFSQVKYINSSGMGILVKLADKCNAIGGEMTLVDVPEKLVALFNMLGLITLIKISKTEEDAIKAFQKNKGNVVSTVDKKIASAEIDNKVIAKTIAENKAAAANKITNENMSAKPTAARPTQTMPKVFVVNCQKCKAKISLGSQLRMGTYCCPRCRAAFKVTEAKKIVFIPSIK